MKNVYNLSYDISVDGEQYDNARDDFFNYLLMTIIDTDVKFTILHAHETITQQTHIVLKPVESTLIFKSALEYGQIATKLHEYQNYNVYYVLNKIDNSDLVGYSHVNPDLQNGIDKKLSILINSMQKPLKDAIRELEKLETIHVSSALHELEELIKDA